MNKMINKALCALILMGCLSFSLEGSQKVRQVLRSTAAVIRNRFTKVAQLPQLNYSSKKFFSQSSPIKTGFKRYQSGTELSDAAWEKEYQSLLEKSKSDPITHTLFKTYNYDKEQLRKVIVFPTEEQLAYERAQNVGKEMKLYAGIY